ncbi:MAG: hypothetical protein JXA71_03795 [Chitinispirillaceae bacterium]|nr:hypothetical protein [Chitinispirillaceae bacterium]
MLYNALQKMLVGAAVLSFAAISPVAAAGNVSVLSDLENGTNENAYGQYWYVYDDSKDGGNTTITNMTKKLDGTYDFLPSDGGNTGTGGTSGKCAKLAFQLGTTKPSNANGDSWGNMVGMGTMLAAENEYMNLTGAQVIKFWAKVERPAGTPASVDLRVEVCTKQFDPGNTPGDYGYYHIIKSIDGTWNQYQIPLSSTDAGFGRLVQWDWSVSGSGAVPFDITQIGKVQWCISEDGNVSAWADAAGVLYIDDVTIEPFTPHFFDEIETNKLGAPGATGLVANNMLCTFDVNVKNSAGFYGYCYTDIDANPVPTSASTISDGATLNDVTQKYTLITSDGGVGGTKCASITFELGTNFLDGTNTVQPFVGIGTNLVLTDANGGSMGEVCDLSQATAIYFDYKLESDNVKFLQFEFGTDQSFGNPGAVYYVKCPNTGGEWKSARVEFTATPPELVLPKWDDVTQLTLDKTKSMKFQWKAQGAARSTGVLAIDNVYTVGKAWDQKVLHTGMRAASVPFQVKQYNNLAQVSFALPQNINGARVDLVSVQGKVLASQSVKRAGMSQYQVAFPTSRLANGSYFVKVNYDNKDVKSSMISILK